MCLKFCPSHFAKWSARSKLCCLTCRYMASVKSQVEEQNFFVENVKYNLAACSYKILISQNQAESAKWLCLVFEQVSRVVGG